MSGQGDPHASSPGERPRVFLTRLIPEPGPSLLAAATRLLGTPEDRRLSREEVLAGVRGAEGILCVLTDRIDAQVLDAAGPQLKVVSTYAVGYDNIDVEAATRRGVLVANTPGVLTEATADLTWALILAASRRVVEGDAFVRAGRFTEWAPRLLLGHDVFGRTLGIVGMGRIGQAVARRAVGFGMPVLYTRRSGPLAPEEVPAGADWRHVERLGDLLSAADIVSLHVPLTPATRHLIGAAELATLRPDAVLVNTARGAVVDEAALVEALASGRVWAAGLDVYEAEPRLAAGLAGLPNVVLLPHLGSGTVETRGRMAELAVRNLLAGLRGGPVPHLVNPQARGCDTMSRDEKRNEA